MFGLRCHLTSLAIRLMTKKLIRLTAITLAFATALTQGEYVSTGVADAETISAVVSSQPVKTSEISSFDRYFYDQLDSNAKKMYDAMYNMYVQGVFKTGSQDYDLGANGDITQSQMEQYANGDNQLLLSMGQARDAFYADHPEVFYVDFSSLSLTVTKDTSGTYHAYLGTGRKDTYYTDGFTSQEQVEQAIAEQDKRIAEIVEGAKSIQVADGENLVAEQVKYVHDQIINTTSYRMEGLCDVGNEGFISTTYGTLVKGQAVCEGYAKTVKAVLDVLGIPCVTVQGIVRWGEDVPQAHMWNYVQVDGNWYGLDATWDDPVNPDGTTNTQGVDGFECSEYLLASEPTMNKCHVASGIMSSVNYEFTYPELSINELGFDTIVADRGLTVQYDEENQTYKVSYNGMGYQKSAEQGKYILAKFYQYDASTGEYTTGGWGYLNPDIYDVGDSDTEITLDLPHIQYVEFAVTNIAQGDYMSDLTYLTYQGDPLLFEAQSGVLYNSNADYVAPPYVESSTPTTSGRLHVGKTYPVTITFDEVLESVDGEEISIDVSCTGTTGVEYSKVENFQWDGKSTITFDFTPSEMWSDDTSLYEFQVTGLVGMYSKKVPNSFRYIVSHPCSAYAYKSQGYDWNIFGQPELLSNVNFDTTDWLTDDGTAITDELKDRLVLVTTKATQSQEDTMLDMVDEQLSEGETVLSSETYNINLTLCKSQVISTGDGVRVSVGFPEGYSSEDENVSFKAYHFKKNAQGEIVGVEPIDCIVTKYGLVITCDSFSPFAVVAVDSSQVEEDSQKSVIIAQSGNGSITGVEDSVFKISAGESKTITIQADEGSQIESVTIGDKVQPLDSATETVVTISYEDIEDSSEVVTVNFVANSVVEKEASRNETVVLPNSTDEISNQFSTLDLLTIKRHILGMVTLPDDTFDLNQDGNIDVLDTITLKNELVK